MNSIVIDASVAIKWFIPEVHSIEAIRLLEKNYQLLAPDLIFSEIGNILWKKCRSKELSLQIATEILIDFKQIPFNIFESEVLLERAWAIATDYQRSLYDSLYVAIAEIENCMLVTADRALFNALTSTPLSAHLLWVENC